MLDDDYDPIESSKYWQFIRKDTDEGPIKVDLLASPPESTELRELTSIGNRRIRPKGQKGILHARLTAEAAFVEDSAISIIVGDEADPVELSLPHPFAYLILKLNALRDRIEDEVKGPYHAFDIYRIVAMMTENEWEESVRFATRYSQHEQVKNTVEIVRGLFADEDAIGVIRARRFALETRQPEPETKALIDDLAELFLRGKDE